MFECRSCLLRGLRAIAGDTYNAQSAAHGRTGLLLTPHLATPPIRRAASTAAALKNVEHDELLSGTQASTGDAFDEADGRRQKGLAIRDEKALRTELRYLSDPLKLAEHVRYTLRCNKPEKALDLCRLASRQQEVIVSWNHCVDWHMSHGRIDEAIKIYNEMKKRAQFPDSYTYVLLLRGLAKDHHHGQVVKRANVIKALSIYNSMTSPTSRVRPSVYHTNATLMVCSMALDMDALWGVAAKLPSKGHGAPDQRTYAILLNAIRHGAVGSNPEGAQLEHIAARRQEAVNQGRRIWQEVVPKWRAGEVHIDEELVCAMGRLLLISKRMQDLDDILNLVHQTMNIERQIAPLGSADRHTEHVPPELSAPGSGDEPPEDAEGYRNAPSTKAFNPVTALPADPSQRGRPNTLAYVTPGNPTLSLLISTCMELRTPKTANAYWDLLTSRAGDLGLQADLDNFHAQFRLLGINRSSARAVQVLKSMPDNDVKPKNMTFRIVMSCCIRDKNNHNALEHARAVVDEMEKHCDEPDIHTLIQYLNLALMTNDGPKIVSALERLDPTVETLRSSRGARKSSEADTRDQKEIAAFFQALIGVIDTLIHRALVPREKFSHWQARRTTLTQHIGRLRARTERDVFGNPQPPSEPAEEDSKAWRRRNKGPPGMQMSRTEYALKRVKWAGKKQERREEGRQKAIRLREWDVGKSRRFGGRGREEGAERSGFADSPMELGMR